MISFGGVVGASIWYGVGSAVAYSGPVGALICFAIIGVDVFLVMQCLGEMSTLFPVSGMFCLFRVLLENRDVEADRYRRCLCRTCREVCG
jgi:amino acid permease